MEFHQPDPIRTERLTLRLMERGDVPALLPYYADPVYLRYLPNLQWSERADGERWFERIDAMRRQGTMLQFVIVERASTAVLGICLLFNLDRVSERAEVGYALGPAHWGRGIASETLQALLHFAFERCALRRVEATVDPRNAASANILLRHGFIHEGTQRERSKLKGELVDTALYGLLQREWTQRD